MIFKDIFRQFKKKDMILFMERIEMCIDAGIPVNVAFATIGKGLKPAHRQISTDIQRSIESGVTLASALSAHAHLPPTVIGLIRHGESSGRLVEALRAVRSLMEREAELSRKCLSALMYPSGIGVFTILAIIGLMQGIMPQIIPMLTGLHTQLPLLTRVVMAISHVVSRYGLFLFIGGMFLGFSGAYLYKKHACLKSYVQICMYRTPILGRLLYLYQCELFLRSCGALVRSDIGASRAYIEVVSVIAFVPFRSAMRTISRQISEGVPFGELLARVSGFPLHIASLITIGEASGTLGSSLIRAADMLDRDIEYSLRRLTSLIEPVMMAGMGCGVGGVALSILLPIYDISRALQH